MRTFLRLFVYAPLGLIILFFAMANRETVPVSLDPFASGGDAAAAPAFQAPFFLVVLLSMALGVLAGGLSCWIGHYQLRRTARSAQREAKEAQAEVGRLRQQALAALPGDPAGKTGR